MQSNKIIIDTTQFAGKTLDDINGILGGLEYDGEINLADQNGATITGEYYSYDTDMWYGHFTFVDNNLVSFQFNAKEPISYNNTSDILERLGIKPSDSMVEAVNTGFAIRWQSVTETIPEVWVQIMDHSKKTFETVRVRYDDRFI